jgi:hypothetical protein
MTTTSGTAGQGIGPHGIAGRIYGKTGLLVVRICVWSGLRHGELIHDLHRKAPSPVGPSNSVELLDICSLLRFAPFEKATAADFP